MILCVSVAIPLGSCGSISPIPNPDEIQITKPAEIEGGYSNISPGKELLHYHQIIKLIDHTGKIKYADSIVSVDVKILDDRRIRFSFIDKKENRYPYISNYKLRNGRIRLKNKNFRLTGIPYLFGGYKLNKTELSLSAPKDLLVRSLQKDEGAILIIFPASVPPGRFKNVYPKK